MLFFRTFLCPCIHISDFLTEKAALLSPDDEVQKSDISSSSQGLVEKEALGPMLLEVKYTIAHTKFLPHHRSWDLYSKLNTHSLISFTPPPSICVLSPAHPGPRWVFLRRQPGGPHRLCLWERDELPWIRPRGADDLKRLQHPPRGRPQWICSQSAAQKPGWVIRGCGFYPRVWCICCLILYSIGLRCQRLLFFLKIFGNYIFSIFKFDSFHANETH